MKNVNIDKLAMLNNELRIMLYERDSTIRKYNELIDGITDAVSKFKEITNKEEKGIVASVENVVNTLLDEMCIAFTAEYIKLYDQEFVLKDEPQGGVDQI